MMSAINAILLAAGSSLAASILAKITLTTALGVLGAWLARQSRAAVRHTILSAAFAMLLAVPIASFVAPPVRIALTTAAPQPIVAAPAGTIRAIAGTRPRQEAKVTPAVPQSTLLLLAAWIAGAVLFLLPVAMGLWQVRSLRRSALPWSRGQSIADAVALDAGIHRGVEVLLHEALPGPMTCGILHPAIILSDDARTWDDGDLTRAIVHELEHVRRGDWLTQCLARAISAVYWFHPLVWIAWRQLALEAERSCDDAVLGRFEATAYADQLVGLAQRLSTAAKSPFLAMANRADLSTRVAAVLDGRQRRGRAGLLTVTLACTIAAILVLGVSPLRIVSAQQPSLPRFVTRTQLVTVTVSISDQNGNPIEGLGANDFVLTEDDVPQKISFLEFQTLTENPAKSYYILGYYTGRRDPNDTIFHNIKVTRNQDPTAKLSFRQGYYTMPPLPQPAVQGGIPIEGKPPQLMVKFEPEYSEEARKAKYQGTVILNVEVDSTGRVTDARVVHSLGLGLDEKAMEAVRKWRFKPGEKDGQPVTMHAEVEVNFRLL
jgi:TonB family protein